MREQSRRVRVRCEATKLDMQVVRRKMEQTQARLVRKLPRDRATEETAKAKGRFTEARNLRASSLNSIRRMKRLVAAAKEKLRQRVQT